MDNVTNRDRFYENILTYLSNEVIGGGELEILSTSVFVPEAACAGTTVLLVTSSFSSGQPKASLDFP